MIVTIEDPSGGTKTYNYGAEAKFADFTRAIESVAPDSKLKLVGEILSNPRGASGYKYKKFGDWGTEKGWAYVLCVDSHIVKIGMTDATLASRFGSYQAGTLRARKKGTCSVTNYYVSEMIRTALNRCKSLTPPPKIEIYALKVPHAEMDLDVLGEVQRVRQKMAHVYETRLLNLYKEQYGSYPCLSNNSSEK